MEHEIASGRTTPNLVGLDLAKRNIRNLIAKLLMETIFVILPDKFDLAPLHDQPIQQQESYEANKGSRSDFMRCHTSSLMQ